MCVCVCVDSFCCSLTSGVRIRDEQNDTEKCKQQARVSQLKTQLELSLEQPLLPAGFSPAYPTFGGHHLSVGTCDKLTTSKVASGLIDYLRNIAS